MRNPIFQSIVQASMAVAVTAGRASLACAQTADNPATPPASAASAHVSVPRVDPAFFAKQPYVLPNGVRLTLAFGEVLVLTSFFAAIAVLRFFRGELTHPTQTSPSVTLSHRPKMVIRDHRFECRGAIVTKWERDPVHRCTARHATRLLSRG